MRLSVGTRTIYLSFSKLEEDSLYMAYADIMAKVRKREISA